MDIVGFAGLFCRRPGCDGYPWQMEWHDFTGGCTRIHDRWMVRKIDSLPQFYQPSQYPALRVAIDPMFDTAVEIVKIAG